MCMHMCMHMYNMCVAHAHALTLCLLQARVAFSVGQLMSSRRFEIKSLFLPGEIPSRGWEIYTGSVLLGPCPRRMFMRYLPTVHLFGLIDSCVPFYLHEHGKSQQQHDLSGLDSLVIDPAQLDTVGAAALDLDVVEGLLDDDDAAAALSEEPREASQELAAESQEVPSK